MQHDRSIAHIFDEALRAEADTRDLESILALYDAAQARCFALSGLSANDHLEIRRRVAGFKLIALATRDAPFGLVTNLYDGLRELGFAGVYQEMLFGSIFAQFCFRAGESELGTGLLLELLTRLRAVRDDVSAAFFDENRQHIEDLLLKHGAKPPTRFL